jgi:hypothetical protein
MGAPERTILYANSGMKQQTRSAMALAHGSCRIFAPWSLSVPVYRISRTSETIHSQLVKRYSRLAQKHRPLRTNSTVTTLTSTMMEGTTDSTSAEGFAGIGLEEASEAGRIKELTDAYLVEQSTYSSIMKCAKTLGDSIVSAPSEISQSMYT